MTEAEVKALMAAIGPVIKEYVAQETRPLKARIAELESAPVLRDAGVWREGMSYGTGAVVTDHGSAWVCKSPTTSRPPDAAWRLMVKRGKDADARLPTKPRGGA